LEWERERTLELVQRRKGPNVGISPEGDALALVMVHLRRQTRELADDLCTTRIQYYLDRCRSRA
jgi:hypothetical protein